MKKQRTKATHSLAPNSGRNELVCQKYAKNIAAGLGGGRSTCAGIGYAHYIQRGLTYLCRC
jgi:hypothetical protein